MDLSVIIVSWNVKEKLRDNLRALLDSKSSLDFEIFVIDNDSKDGSAVMIAEEFPGVRLIANKENLGFAKANNQAIKLAKGRYVLLLNPDMKVFGDTLPNMVQWMDMNPQAAVSGCHLVDESGNTIRHVRRFPTVWDQLAIVLKMPHLFPGILDRYLCRDFDYACEAEVDSIRGSFFMIRRRLIDEIGGLDERYFVWFEEVDYCRQTKQTEWKVMYTPAATCTDLIGKSFSQVKRGKTQEYFRDSMLKYFQKWHNSIEYRILNMAWPIGMTLAWLADKSHIKREIKT